MQIKSLEIQGFKSFPDRVKFTFHSGITAVVGPNGSGKSNIVDAVRWVFGEQSTKTLRGSRMEDVIFGGTARRRPQSSATVTLVLANADRSLPVDSDEVAITRRFYRSGESEYRLNGAGVRLRDIYELFMDTGLGRDGYSVIGQGRIAEIISSRSSERREIFEEAAGISKYRYRRGEAERRLSAAEENMLRLRDILSELEGRVEPLRREAEKAERFLALSEEKKSLEIGVWLTRIDRLDTQYRELHDRFLAARGEYEAADRENAALEERIAALYTQMQEQAVAIDGLRARLREWEADAARIRSEQAVGENDIAHSRERIAALTRQQEEGEEASRQGAAALAEAEARATALDEQRTAAEQAVAAAGEAVTAAGEALAAVDADTERLKFRRAAIYQQLDEARSSGAASRSLRQETSRRLEEIRAASAGREQALEQRRRELADCESLAAAAAARREELTNTRRGYELRLQSRRERRDQLAQKVEALRSEAAGQRQRAALLEGMEKSLEGYSFSVKFILQQAGRGQLTGVCGSVSQLIAAAEPRFATAIEIALGGAMQNLIVENEEVAKRCIRLLDREKKGRATFLPLTSVRGRRMDDRPFAGMAGVVGIASALVRAEDRYTGVVEQLLGRILIAEDLDAAVSIARACGYRFRIVTLDGQVINSGGAMTGGYTAKSTGLLGRRDEIDRLEAAAAALERQAADQQKAVDGAAEEQSRVEGQIWAVDAEIRQLDDDRIRAESEKKRLEEALAAADASARREEEEEQKLAARLEELTGRSRSAEEVLAALTAELEQVGGEIAAAEDRRRALDAEGRDRERRRAEAELAALEVTKDLDAAHQEAARLRSEQAGGQQQAVQAHIRTRRRVDGQAIHANPLDVPRSQTRKNRFGNDRPAGQVFRPAPQSAVSGAEEHKCRALRRGSVKSLQKRCLILPGVEDDARPGKIAGRIAVERGAVLQQMRRGVYMGAGVGRQLKLQLAKAVAGHARQRCQPRLWVARVNRHVRGNGVCQVQNSHSGPPWSEKTLRRERLPAAAAVCILQEHVGKIGLGVNDRLDETGLAGHERGDAGAVAGQNAVAVYDNADGD